MLVYLFELDSVRNSKEEIKRGQQALLEEIVIRGNQVVLSFNQLTDSKAFLSLLEDKEIYESIIALFECGAIKISEYRNTRTGSQYIQNAIDTYKHDKSRAFLFSALPVSYDYDQELLDQIKSALMYGDIAPLEKQRDQLVVGSAEWEKMDYIVRYIQIILLLSVNKPAINPGKENIEHSFIDYMEEIICLCKNDSNPQMKQCAELLSEIASDLADTVKNGDDSYRKDRTNWIRILNELEENEITDRAEAIIDLCYNYTIEESIAGVAKHFSDMEDFPKDFWNRFYQYWQDYQDKIHFFHKKNRQENEVVEQIKKTKDKATKEEYKLWNMASRLARYNSYKKVSVGVTFYEVGYEYQKSKWKRIRNINIGKWMGTALIYMVIFVILNVVISDLQNMFLSGTILATILFGLLGSWLSERFHLVDVLECAKRLGIGLADTGRIRKASKGIAYRRKNVSRNNKGKRYYEI